MGVEPVLREFAEGLGDRFAETTVVSRLRTVRGRDHPRVGITPGALKQVRQPRGPARAAQIQQEERVLAGDLRDRDPLTDVRAESAGRRTRRHHIHPGRITIDLGLTVGHDVDDPIAVVQGGLNTLAKARQVGIHPLDDAVTQPLDRLLDFGQQAIDEAQRPPRFHPDRQFTVTVDRRREAPDPYDESVPLAHHSRPYGVDPSACHSICRLQSDVHSIFLSLAQLPQAKTEFDLSRSRVTVSREVPTAGSGECGDRAGSGASRRSAGR